MTTAIGHREHDAFRRSGEKQSYYKEDEQFWRERATRVESIRKWSLAQESPPGNTPSCKGFGSSTVLDGLLLEATGGCLRQPSARHLELHRRVLDLSGLRAKILNEVDRVEAWKGAVCQQKLAQQAALVSKLNARLHGVLEEAERQASELKERVRDIDEYSARCAKILQGLESDPSGKAWDSLEGVFNRLVNLPVNSDMEVDRVWMEQAFLQGGQGHESNESCNSRRVQELETQLAVSKAEALALSKQLDDNRAVTAEFAKEQSDLQASLDQVLCSASEREGQLSRQRTKYQAAIEELEKRHQLEVDRLEALLKERICCGDESLEASAKNLDLSTDPQEQLRRAMTESSGKADHSKHSNAKLRESYQKMIMELQNNHHKDKERIQHQHTKDMEALKEAHQKSLDALIQQLQQSGGEKASLMEAEIKIVQEDKKRLQVELENLVKEFESKKEYALYSQRCEHEKQIIQLRDECQEFNLAAQKEVDSLQAALESMHRSGAVTPTKVRNVVEDALRIKEAEYRAHALKSDEVWAERLENLKVEYQAALGEREREFDALLSELHRVKGSESKSTDSSGSERSSGHLSDARGEGSCEPKKSVTAAVSPTTPGTKNGLEDVDTKELKERDSHSTMSEMVNAVLGNRQWDNNQQQYHSSLQKQSHRGTGSRCIRCGSTESSGMCRFHPALLQSPGPLLYSPEWHACKSAGHSSSDPGCFSRREHYRPPDLIPNHLPSKLSPPPASLSPPKPRSKHPIPSQP